MNRELKLGVYRHFKGKDKLYRVLGTGIDSESLEEVVIYICLYGEYLGKIFIRNKNNFLEEVPKNKENPNNQKYRFEYIE